MHAWKYMYNICHICTYAHWTHATHTHEQYENVHTQYMWTYTCTSIHNVCRTYTWQTHMHAHTIYTTWHVHMDIHIPTFSNHLAALCSSTREAQHLTGSPQHQKAAGTSRSHRKACDHRPGPRTDPPNAKQPVVCHMGPCGHSVGDTVISFRGVYNNILSHWNCEPPEEQTWQPDRWVPEGQLCCSSEGSPWMGLPPLLVPSAICSRASREGELDSEADISPSLLPLILPSRKGKKSDASCIWYSGNSSSHGSGR